MNANMIALLAGFVIAVSPGLKLAFFSPNGSLLWLSSAAITIGTPMVGVTALIVGATLGMTMRRVCPPRPPRPCARPLRSQRVDILCSSCVLDDARFCAVDTLPRAGSLARPGFIPFH